MNWSCFSRNVAAVLTVAANGNGDNFLTILSCVAIFHHFE